MRSIPWVLQKPARSFTAINNFLGSKGGGDAYCHELAVCLDDHVARTVHVLRISGDQRVIAF